MMMKFTAQMIADLTPQLIAFPGAIDQVAATVMTVQRILPNGRVNVSFVQDGHTMYRTYAARDLIAA